MIQLWKKFLHWKNLIPKNGKFIEIDHTERSKVLYLRNEFTGISSENFQNELNWNDTDKISDSRMIRQRQFEFINMTKTQLFWIKRSGKLDSWTHILMKKESKIRSHDIMKWFESIKMTQYLLIHQSRNQSKKLSMIDMIYME